MKMAYFQSQTKLAFILAIVNKTKNISFLGEMEKE
jgi:hypothetical protein